MIANDADLTFGIVGRGDPALDAGEPQRSRKGTRNDAVPVGHRILRAPELPDRHPTSDCAITPWDEDAR